MSGMCPIAGCGRERPVEDDVGVCGECGVRIARRYKERVIHEYLSEQGRKREARAEAHSRRVQREASPIADLYAAYEQPPGSEFVYYVRIGDHIKIGYSSRVLGRLSALRVPISDLLALEPGGRAQERERHEQFGHLRISRRWENFAPADDLTAHIDALVAEHGLPRWLNAPRRGKNGPIEVRRV